MALINLILIYFVNRFMWPNADCMVHLPHSQLAHLLTSPEEWWRPRACEGFTLAFFFHSLLCNQFLFLCLPLVLAKRCQWVFKVPIIINHLTYISNLRLSNCCDKMGEKLIRRMKMKDSTKWTQKIFTLFNHYLISRMEDLLLSMKASSKSDWSFMLPSQRFNLSWFLGDETASPSQSTQITWNIQDTILKHLLFLTQCC